ERNFETGSGADLHGIEGGEILPIDLWGAQHHFDLVSSALDALDFIPIKGLSHLFGEITDGHAELLCLGL
ncbi:hypothetical protein ABFV44_24900, partial [Pseudomonas poae]